ncbi:MAG: glutamate synthase subunit alpha, partial [Anaeromyxobacteraceae bacterium]
VDLTQILHFPEVPEGAPRHRVKPPPPVLDDHLDWTVLEQAAMAVENHEPTHLELGVRNVNRCVGGVLSSRIAQRYGADGLPADTLEIDFTGSAGQSFGAFAPPGLTLTLEGDANDYIGKGLSGGKLVVYPPAEAGFVAEENVIVGNVAFYGATGGEAYVRGMAGERFCVRNSGVHAVVEGVGDHGCEYMTGGRVVILGPTGRNFAAGMSGGVAYVLDQGGAFAKVCNPELVSLSRLEDEEEIALVRRLVERHAQYTRSPLARRVLDGWKEHLSRFVRVVPNDYRRVLDAQARMRKKGLSAEEAEMAAFEENAHDVMRVGGT